MFENVTVGWKGKEYTLRPRKRMEVMARVERVLTFGEMHRHLSERGSVPVYTLSMAYGALLRSIGAAVTDEEIASDLFKAPGALDSAIEALSVLLAPPGSFDDEAEGGAAEPAANPPQPAEASS